VPAAHTAVIEHPGRFGPMETAMDPRTPHADIDLRPTMPAELLTEFDDAHFGPIDELLHETDHAAAPLPVSVDLWTLSRFKSLMLREGWPVHAARMIFDRVYAHERLAFAHSSANDLLRGLALDIFRRMHAQDGASNDH
jgi:hypothetical protein